MWLLSFLNPIGKAIDVFGAYVNKRQDVDLEKYKVNGTISVKAMETDRDIIQARAELAKARANDAADSLGRILLTWSIGGYVAANVYGLVFHDKLPKWILLNPQPLDANMTYLFMAVIGYLLVTSWRGAK
jgi:hypothetical protein